MNFQDAIKANNDVHVCTPEECPASGGYYVSCVDGDALYLMAGPYQTHQEALDAKDKALNIAYAINGKAWFMKWGTCRRKDDYREPGRLNRFGLI